MAKYTIEDTTLSNIANAIRTKGNTTESLTPTQMPDAINAIEAGSKQENITSYLGTGFQPSTVDGYASGGRRYYSTGSSSYTTQYYWYRSSNTNVYWQVCAWSPSKFVSGHKYRISTWIWHSGEVSNEPIPFWQNNVFFNGAVNVDNPLKEITTTPQLLTITFDYIPSDNYGAVFYIYPEDSGNQVRLTPLVVEDLTSPTTSYPAMAI